MPQPNRPTNDGPIDQQRGPIEVSPHLSASMTALAQVAVGVAPALNDLLTVITGRANLLLDQAGTDAPTRESLNEIYTAGERAVSLIRQLLLFGGCEKLHEQVVDLNHLVEENNGVLHRVLGGTIVTELRLAPNLPLVTADPAMLEQVLLGLVWNARDAMPQGGRLAITTTPVSVSEDAVKSYPGGRAGSFVSLSVADTGAGIPSEILPRIFDPFFTTKAAHGNVGLGLAVIFGILRQHRGWVAVDSVVGRGATFTVFLPATAADAQAGARAPSDAKAGSGREAILLVEDDTPVREFTAAVLRSHGYRVLQAPGTTEALETWKWHGERIGLLLTDMVLEDMSGLDLAARLRREKPGLAVICTSGHGREIMERPSSLGSGCTFLAKPCRPQVLIRAVRTALNPPSS